MNKKPETLMSKNPETLFNQFSKMIAEEIDQEAKAKANPKLNNDCYFTDAELAEAAAIYEEIEAEYNSIFNDEEDEVEPEAQEAKAKAKTKTKRMIITARRGFSVAAPIEETLLLGCSHAEINHIKSYNDLPWFNLDCYRTANNNFIVKVKKLYLADPHKDDSILVWGDAETVFDEVQDIYCPCTFPNCRCTFPKHDEETLHALYLWLMPHF